MVPIATVSAPTAGSTSGRESFTVIAGYGLAIARALQHAGADVDQVFSAAGLSRALSNDPMQRLPLDTVSRLYRASVESTGDPYFGLSVARFIHVSTAHALGYGLLASATLMDFCQRVQRYIGLATLTCRAEVVIREDEVCLRTVPKVAISAETQDAWCGLLYLLMRQIHRDDFRPLAVEFAHPVPHAGDGPYVRFFDAPVHFDRDAVTLVLPRADMEIPLPGACAELARINDNLAASYVARLDRDDVVANTRAQIIDRLPGGDVGKRTVAASLGISESTLRNRLAEHGTGFHELLDSVRSELACSYLSQSRMSVTEVAFLLGFTDVSNFTRAFKRWTGMSPSRFRECI